tara:strand:+ start:503 stop:688 length:186 start_codon:yes stop_codon:yes gene_type:complete
VVFRLTSTVADNAAYDHRRQFVDHQLALPMDVFAAKKPVNTTTPNIHFYGRKMFVLIPTNG